MVKRLFCSIIFITFFNNSYSQQNIDSILNFTLAFRGLTQQDITIPINFDKEKSPRNDAKLLLPVVKEIMQEPMKSFGFMDSLSESNYEGKFLLNQLFALNNYSQTGIEELRVIKKNGSINSPDIIKISEIGLNNPEGVENSVKLLTDFIKFTRKVQKMLISPLTEDELNFLSVNLLSVISETESVDGNNSDIFKFNQERDTSIYISKKTLDLLSKIKRQEVYEISSAEFISCYSLYRMFSMTENIYNSPPSDISSESIMGDYLYYYDKGGIRIAIGSKGNNVYTGDFDFIIDPGGNDVYNITNGQTDYFLKENFSCIIDLSGDDFYNAITNYSLAGAVFSSGFIFDKEGDDTYKGKNVSLGSAICGLGVLYDENGNDTYQANQFSIGAASFGVGLLVDRNGNDVYIANSYSQGFGMTEGVGAIVDNKGNDNYLIDARSLDIGRYEDHYVSMSQGYGLGLRPYYAGGIGLIIEGEGNDFYSTDIFGQGGAYWYALGCIVDKSGHDKYNSYQYAQGAGIHLAVGLLKDYDGWDFYTSDGVSQGCGHDFGFGLLYDVKGNDNYSAYSLSQGAGNANGIGMLIDESGRDGYLNKEPGNTRGYGNYRREYGSLGIFLDASGEDFYSVGGMDSVIKNSSTWGVMDDYYLTDQKSQASGNTFKIPLDSNKNYTEDELFIMAKTIEPRFSQWQEYGFRKLVEDSTRTAEYIMKYLDTDDHRDGLVLRNLALKIGYTMGNYFTEKLRYYNLSMSAKPIFNQNEIAFICYLFGETGNPAGKEELFNLTFDENVRVRTVAVNSLGKINIDTADSEFINKTAARLRELANENSTSKLYNKDIAYAFKNYKNFDNIAALINLMSNDYFGARFLAAEGLKTYGDIYYEFINDELISKISGNPIWYAAFLNSIEYLSEEKFKKIFSKLTELNLPYREEINLNYLDLLKRKLSKSELQDFKEWADSLITELQSKSILKIN